jgi:uncharacterized membrane-anchored protein YjiN (DUF445 family)
MTEEEKRARLSRMRLVALAVLAAMFAVFAASSTWQGSIPALQWLRAFSEAGIAGAIADWYAVVALFRHPLGLPMPHTAIIPRNKERIAESIGAFIETHFLTSQNVVERVVRFDFAAAASHWLREQTNSRKLADALCDLIPPTLETVEDAEFRQFFEDLVASEAEAIDFVAIVDHLMATIVDLNLDRTVLKRVLLWLRDWVSKNRDTIKLEFGRASRYTPGFIDTYVVNRFVDGVAHFLEDAAENPDHQVWDDVDLAIKELQLNLRTSHALREQIASNARAALAGFARSGVAQTLWFKVKRYLAADLSDERSQIRSWMTGAFQRVGAAIADDPVVQQKLNAWQVASIEATLPRARPAIGRWVADIVKSWDTAQITDKLETELGTDLQYIRLNGAIVGGLVGVALHFAQL